MAEELSGLIERLRARRDSGQRTIGGATASADGHFESWGCEPIMVLANPDGPEAADALEALSAECEGLRTLVHESLYHLRLDEAAKAYHDKACAALNKESGNVG